jgi:hypothetical protein
VSIPRKTIVKKNINTQRFGQGNIDNAFGNMLKLNDGPERDNWCIETFY